MAVGREGQRDLREPIAARALVERERHRHEGTLEKPLAIGKKAIDQPLEVRRGGVEGSADRIASDLLQLASNNGGEQVAGPCCYSILSVIACLPSGFND